MPGCERRLLTNNSLEEVGSNLQKLSPNWQASHLLKANIRNILVKSVSSYSIR